MKYDFVNEKDVVPVKRFDADSAVAHFNSLFGGAIAKMRKQADALVVSNENDIVKATEMASQAKKLYSAAEKKRVEIKKPYLEFTQTLDSLVRTVVKKPLAEIQKIVESKAAPVILAVEERREKERLAAAKKAAEAAKKAAAANMPVFNMPVVAKPSAVSDGKAKSDTGSMKVEKETKWSLVDFEKVPNEYKIVTLDTKKIDAAIKSGAMIPGLRVYQDAKVTTKLNR